MGWRGRRIVLISGLSGAGCSTALHALEDQGFESVDNAPLSLLPEVARRCFEQHPDRPIALGFDIRNADEMAQWQGLRAQLDPIAETSLLFLECDEGVILRRYSETRRRHPVGAGRALREAVALEYDLLAPVRQEAELRIDTTAMNVHQLRRAVIDRLGMKGDPALVLLSFGFKRGLPMEADFLFDARFLPNPYFDPDLRPLSGCDRPVADCLQGHDEVGHYLDSIEALMRQVLPGFAQALKRYVTIAIGCTGGQHRSVYLIEGLAHRLASHYPDLLVRHRDKVDPPDSPPHSTD